MARANPSVNAQIFRDRRVQIAAALAAVLAVAAVVFLVVGGNQGETEPVADATTSAVPSASPAATPGFPDAPGGGAGQSFPGSPGFAGVGGGATSRAAGGTQRAVPNSFTGAPRLLGGSGGGQAAAAADPAVTSPFGGGGGVGGASAAAAPPKPAPVQPGRQASYARVDPFVSFYVRTFQRAPAYTFAVPLRLASYPRPTVDRSKSRPEEILGPLPFVPRRVAGVLYNGSVSAILETGNPGGDADVRVVQPGAFVPSGVPGLPDFTVESISPSKLTLRSQDRRTVDVNLTNLPAGVADQLRGQAGGGGIPGGGFPGGAAGGYPGAGGGFPGGGGYPGIGGGGRGARAPL